MELNDLLNFIKQDISKVKDQGAKAIGVDSLIGYLDSLSQNIEKNEFHKDRDTKLEIMRIETDWGIALFNSVIASGQSTLKAGMLLHGGAAIALLAFMGHLAVNPDLKHRKRQRKYTYGY